MLEHAMEFAGISDGQTCPEDTNPCQSALKETSEKITMPLSIGVTRY